MCSDDCGLKDFPLPLDDYPFDYKGYWNSVITTCINWCIFMVCIYVSVSGPTPALCDKIWTAGGTVGLWRTVRNTDAPWDQLSEVSSIYHTTSLLWTLVSPDIDHCVCCGQTLFPWTTLQNLPMLTVQDWMFVSELTTSYTALSIIYVVHWAVEQERGEGEGE